MIPLRDSIRSRRFPVVNVLLIAVNILVFLFEWTLSDRQLALLFRYYGVVPLRFASMLGGPASSGPGLTPVLTLITSQFMHGGPVHVAGNMLYLWVFGDNVEDRMGRLRYLVFYLLLGSLSGLAHVLFNVGSPIPTIGASGAVAGILGAYFISYPRSRVVALIPLIVFWTVTEVPAVIFLFLWFLLQLGSGVASLRAAVQVGAGVAWWAHIGGFIAGAALVNVFKGRRRWPYY
ncbi:MAG: rhomboid family intramembrane serine protease [Firmicutes bacterium]|nr:rhomboid family intramembrane serine protease [Bacillota bacterium]